MKKNLITITILIFTATITGYSQFFKENYASNTRTADGNSYNASKHSSENAEEIKEHGGFFKAPAPGGPGDRPETGGGIGQEAPLGDGLTALVVCSVFFGLFKWKQSIRRK